MRTSSQLQAWANEAAEQLRLGPVGMHCREHLKLTLANVMALQKIHLLYWVCE